jgi:hypothetical protein
VSVFLAAIPAPGQATPLWTIDFDTAPVGSYIGSVDSGDFGAPYSCGGLLQVAETAGATQSRRTGTAPAKQQPLAASLTS